MLAKVHSCALVGLDGVLVDVEVDVAQGLPAYTIVGLPDAAVQEARERTRAAIRNSGAVFPNRRLTITLAPAAVRKVGPLPDSWATSREITRSSWVRCRSTAPCATPTGFCRWWPRRGRRAWSAPSFRP